MAFSRASHNVGTDLTFAVAYAVADVLLLSPCSWASPGASRLQNYILCSACSVILALTQNSIESVAPHRLSVRKAIGQSSFLAESVSFESRLLK